MSRVFVAKAVVAAIVVLGTAFHPPLSAADLANTIEFKIAPQALPAALLQYSQQSGVQVASPSELLEGKSSVGVVGKLPARDALKQLLQGTGLDYGVVDTGAVIIHLLGAAADATSGDVKVLTAEPLSAARNSADGLKLVQANPAPGDAQSRKPSQENDRAVGEIVVTAQKRVERLIEVPISVVALSAEELARRGATSIDDLALVVPGMSVASNGASRRINIRGVSNIFGNNLGSLIGIYLDEAAVTGGVATQLDLQAYDLERVEVLRGPQGTLYGEGSVGGTIRFITRSPSLDRFGMSADATALQTEEGSDGQRVDLMLNAPIVAGKVGVRIAGTYEHAPGWIDQPLAGKEDINDKELTDVRAKALWTPTEEFAVNAMALIHRNDMAPSQGEDANGNYTQAFELALVPRANDNYDLYNLTMTYEFPSFQLLSATTLLEAEVIARNMGFMFQATPPPAGLTHSLQRLREQLTDVTTQELRMSSTGNGRWKWTVGGFYRDAKFDFQMRSLSVQVPRVPGSPIPAPLRNSNTTGSKSWAAFADASFNVTDRITLGAGLRYFEDSAQYISSFNGIFAARQDGTFDSWNPRIYAQYKFSRNAQIYANAAKGFRSGGFNNAGIPPYDPEDVWSYELGTKMVMASGRFTADVAVFYSDYRNYQITSPSPLSGTVSLRNAGDARIRGVEWAFGWQPADRWQVGLSGNRVESEFNKIIGSPATQLVGDQLDQVPKYLFTASGQRDFTLIGREGYFRLDYSQMGASTYKNRRIGLFYFSESDVINSLNVNAGLQWNDRVQLSVFGQNLRNDRGYIDPFVIESGASRARPRTYGVRVGVAF